MLNVWKNLSVAKKLYAVFGVMALLILLELVALGFAMNTLSALRAFVEGEALWSKAQKNAIHSLHQYAITKDRSFYDAFRGHLRVPMGDHQARLELGKSQPDYDIMFAGFQQGGIHPQDIPGVINLMTRFQRISYLQRAIAVWTRGDDLIQDLIQAADVLQQTIENNSSPSELKAALVRLGQINDQLTELEIEFSKALGEGSRWLESLLFFVLLIAVLTVESTGLFLTFSFSRNLSRSLHELSSAAASVGQGDFTQMVPVRGRDELGQLAVALNKMIKDLQINVGQREKAESASQSKSLFLANVSHELRTPLGVILGYIELMKDPALSNQDRARYLEIIDHTGKNLNRIVNDILDISKVEAGHLDIKVIRFNFQSFIEDVARMLQLKAQTRQTQLQFKSVGPLPVCISTDRDRLRQILVNLVNNALKFTEKGKVTIRYWIKADELHFEVADTGVGIPEDQHDRLFQRFARTDTAQLAGQEGAGLGLALSRGIARILGGDVDLKESRLGHGSIFTASIKLTQSPTAEETPEQLPEQPQAPTAEDLERLRGKHILVVDDAPENQMVVRLFLVKEGVEVETADDGKAGIETALAKPFDLILMDMQMPVMNGFDATRELRRQGYTKPIVAFTANAMKGDEARCLEAGCNALVTKPIEPRHLLKTLAELI